MGLKRKRNISAEELQFENEMRKAKKTLEQGAYFGGGEKTPPEIESIFLDHIEKFEKEFNNCKRVTVHERLGKPLFRHVSEIKENQIKDELGKLLATMANNGIIAESIHEVEDMEIYRFITEELFPHEIDDIKVAGMNTHFTYEEFHPNYDADAKERVRDFASTILYHSEKDDDWFLKEHLKVITSNSIYNDEFLNKIKLFRSFYEKFKMNLFEITALNIYDEKTHAEVLFKINITATFEDSTKTQTIRGTGRAVVQRKDEWWEIMQFEMPGIKL